MTKVDLEQFLQVENRLKSLATLPEIREWTNKMNKQMADTRTEMQQHSASMATNTDIIRRYDEILCEKVSKMYLTELEANLDRNFKHLKAQIADLKSQSQ